MADVSPRKTRRQSLRKRPVTPTGKLQESEQAEGRNVKKKKTAKSVDNCSNKTKTPESVKASKDKQNPVPQIQIIDEASREDFLSNEYTLKVENAAEDSKNVTKKTRKKPPLQKGMQIDNHGCKVEKTAGKNGESVTISEPNCSGESNEPNTSQYFMPIASSELFENKKPDVNFESFKAVDLTRSILPKKSLNADTPVKAQLVQNDTDIRSLLLQFESKDLNLGTADNRKKEGESSEDDSDWEDVEDADVEMAAEIVSQVPDGPVEITLEGTDIMRKKKKKKFDMQEWYRLQVNKYKRFTQSNAHKVHLLCLVAHGIWRNQICDTPLLKASLLSHIPAQFLHISAQKWSRITLNSYTNWFRKTFYIGDDGDDQSVGKDDCLYSGFLQHLIKKAKAPDEEQEHTRSKMPKSAPNKKTTTSPKESKSKVSASTSKQTDSRTTKGKCTDSLTLKGKLTDSGTSKGKCTHSRTSKGESKSLSIKRETKSSTKRGKTKIMNDGNETESPYFSEDNNSMSQEPLLKRVKTDSYENSNIKHLKKNCRKLSQEENNDSHLKLGKNVSSSTSKNEANNKKSVSNKSRVGKGRKSDKSAIKEERDHSSVKKDKDSAYRDNPEAKQINSKDNKHISGENRKKSSMKKEISDIINLDGVVDSDSGISESEENCVKNDGGKNVAGKSRNGVRAKNFTRRKSASKIADYCEVSSEHSDEESTKTPKQTTTKKNRSRRSSSGKLGNKSASIKSEHDDDVNFEPGDLSSAEEFEPGETSFRSPPTSSTSIKRRSSTGSSSVRSKKKATSKSSSSRPSSAKKSKVVTILSSDSEGSVQGSESIDVWAEVYVNSEKKWICVDCLEGAVDKPARFEEQASQPIQYVLAFLTSGHMKDITKKYASNWMSYTRKLRHDNDWWQETLTYFTPPIDEIRHEDEDRHIEAKLLSQPLPTAIGDFKNHPLYALRRHLLKFEGIYPPDAPPLGFVRNEPVYARECVHTLHSKENWMKEGRALRLKEEPYKWVKARPKKNRAVNSEEPTLALYGHWQTEDYIPPPAVDGKVPRNEYGNVELFKPSMLPAGTVHLQGFPGLNRVSKKLGLDAVAAMTGWEQHCGFAHPILEGWVVCVEHKDILIAAWDEQQEIDRARDQEKREKRVFDNWRKLTKGVLIKQRIKKKYNLVDAKEMEEEESNKNSANKKSGKSNKKNSKNIATSTKATDASVSWPLNRQEEKQQQEVHDKNSGKKLKKKESVPLFPFEMETM